MSLKDRWNSWVDGRFPDLTDYAGSLADARDDAVLIAHDYGVLAEEIKQVRRDFQRVLALRDEEIDRLNECISLLERLVML